MKNNYLEKLFSLDNKTAVLTGASGYFGYSFAECLLSAGAKVILYGRGEKIEKTAEKLTEKYNKAKINYYRFDLYNEKHYLTALRDTVKSNKNIDILINNAFEFSKKTGFNDLSGKFENISKKQWMRSMEAGVYWSALSTQIIGEKMKKQKKGSIINISSMYSLVAPDPKLYEGVDVFNPPSYGAAKAALNALTRYTASFYGAYSIRCNTIVAGSFPNTDRTAYNSPKDAHFMEKLAVKTVLNRVGRTDDLAGALIFLASDSSSYITGQVMVVDGGWTIR